MPDLTKYKGIYFGDETKKYQDPATGAHFDYVDLCMRIECAIKERKQMDEILGQ